MLFPCECIDGRCSVRIDCVDFRVHWGHVHSLHQIIGRTFWKIGYVLAYFNILTTVGWHQAQQRKGTSPKCLVHILRLSWIFNLILLCEMFFISASSAFLFMFFFHSLHIVLISWECYWMLLMFLLFLFCFFAVNAFRDVSIKLFLPTVPTFIIV